jgi:ribosomal-protein-alanine N-acetyltransferase
METLETERLRLRDFVPNDLFDFYEYAKVPGVGECAGWKHHEGIEDSAAILDLFIKEGKTYALVYKESGKVIGSLGFSETHLKANWPGLRVVEIGYVLSKDYWGRGLMTEAVKRVIDYLFVSDQYDIVVICHYDFNKRSERVILKAGLHYLKTLKHVLAKGVGKYYDSLVFFISKEEYLKSKSLGKAS